MKLHAWLLLAVHVTVLWMFTCPVSDCSEIVGNNKTLTIGFLVSMSGPYTGGMTMASTIPIAIDDLAGDPLLHGYRLKYLWRDSGCYPGKALQSMTELLNEGVDVIIGPSCSYCCKPTQYLASTLKLAQVLKLPTRYLVEPNDFNLSKYLIYFSARFRQAAPRMNCLIKLCTLLSSVLLVHPPFSDLLLSASSKPTIGRNAAS